MARKLMAYFSKPNSGNQVRSVRVGSRNPWSAAKKAKNGETTFFFAEEENGMISDQRQTYLVEKYR